MLIFLIGFSGSGKTYWGQKWAEAFNFTHIDIDKVIEEKMGKTVSEIFEHKGEQYFRQLESQTLEPFLNQQNTIVSCGGGLPCFFDNMKKMNDAGITIYLKADPDFLYNRLISEIEERPLLKKIPAGEVLEFITVKLAEREPVYSLSKITLDAENLSERSFAEILVPMPRI